MLLQARTGDGDGRRGVKKGGRERKKGEGWRGVEGRVIKAADYVAMCSRRPG